MHRLIQSKPGVQNGFSNYNMYVIFLLITGIYFIQIPENILIAQENKKNELKNLDNNDYKVFKDIFYKSKKNLTEYEKDRCFLDLYLPKSIQNFPVIVWFHGGSLKHFNKDHSYIQAIGISFAHRGVAVAVVNYRLSPMAKYPAYIDDAAASVAWTIKNIT